MHTWTTTTRVSQDAQDEPSAFGLTALSALTAPQPSSMAHIVKWWRTLGKTRFFNGYKQLSALQQDSHDGRSDTEELLLGGRPSPSPCPPCPEPPRESRESLASAVPPPGQDLQGLKERERERTPSQERAARRERLPSPDREKDKEREKADKPQPQQPEQQPNRQINFEEFECDVSVEGGVDEAGQERQEFSFTLYDFDGHGKITKDDITGLVSTIYETLGASITVPHYGSKTIKVKLTVSPDKRHGGSKGATATYANTATYVNSGVTGSAAAADNAAEPQTTPPTRVRFKRDLNVTIQERRPLRQTTRRASSASVRRRPSAAATAVAAAAAAAAAQREREREREHSEDRGYVVHSCGSSCRGSGPGSDGSGEDEDVDDEEDDGEGRPATGLSPASVAAAAATAATVATAAANVANGCQSPHAKKRSSSMQRQELLQIIQANMEKNNLCFQTAKKSCAEKTGLEERRHSHSGVHPHHRRQKQKAAPPVSLSASASPQRIYDYATTPYYVNLADKGECPGDADTYRYVVCTPKHQPTYHNVPCRERGHNRSRSHDLTTNSNTHSHAHQHNHSHSHNPAAPLFRYTLLQEDTTSSVQAFHVRPSRSPAITRRARLPPTAVGHSGVGHTAVGHTSSPHHLKHRNREQDQARAMAQVVQWLEQEFSASLNTRTSAGVREVLINAKAQRTKSKAAAFAPVPEAPPPPAPSAPSAAPNAAPNAHSHSNSSRPDEEPSPSGPGVKQHEHHHVHEHIHHHYHHYQDTSPVLV